MTVCSDVILLTRCGVVQVVETMGHGKMSREIFGGSFFFEEKEISRTELFEYSASIN